MTTKTQKKPAKAAPAVKMFKGDLGDHARHGDVLLRRVDVVPDGCEKIPGGTLRHGTATGHSHQFKADVQMHRAKDATVYVEVTGTHADLVHEEHKTIRFPRGMVLRYIQQKEWTGADEQAVLD